MAYQPPHYVVQVSDSADELKTNADIINPFDDVTIRRAFIGKVYSILTFQLVTTLGLIFLFVFCTPLKTWVLLNSWFTIALFPSLLILILMLACCEGPRRKVPHNFFLLFLFTLVQGTLLGAVSVYYHANEVMWSIGGTALVTLVFTLFAFQTKIDFTYFSPSGLSCLLLLMIYGLICLFLRSYYLVVNTHLMLGRSRQYSLNPEEYVFAALNLYLDIVNIFIFFLHLIASLTWPHPSR
ncbi:protein lifeguard 2 isoform X2 [Monodelphis domestica]|uniref:protein lifeguard 2 isoform X2 n=1 Tax=Monodelphis domestica TaxID=13616 RepID=UPI0004435D89|nr:protein lifeguard 2 isoform X2 [Monodelphis domestica]